MPEISEAAKPGATVAERTDADDGPKTQYTIGDLAREFDITPRTLRFYEDKNLLHPRRRGSTRLYSRRDRARLKLVLMGKNVGFSLGEIKDMLDLYDLRDGQITQMRVARDKFQQQISHLEEQKANIEQAIAELKRTVAIVSGMLKEKEAKAE